VRLARLEPSCLHERAGFVDAGERLGFVIMRKQVSAR